MLGADSSFDIVTALQKRPDCPPDAGGTADPAAGRVAPI